MSKTVEIKKAVIADILPIAFSMREADVKEVWDSNRHSPYKSLYRSMVSGGRTWTIVVDGVPVGMVGVAPASLISNTGRPWLLGSEELVSNKKLFLIMSTRILKTLTRGYDRLENYVSSENKASLLWLEKLGFSFGEEINSVTNVIFKRFYMDIERG